jgi:flagellar hook-associated protein 1 FlgK
MSKISLMMDTGKRSMANNQTALSTVGHNIANKSTEGYSRQRVEIQSNVPITEGRLQIGTGARAAQVTRVNNPYLEKQIQKEGAQSGFLEARADAMAQVEQVYNEQMNKGLSQYMGEFFNAFRELANYPESSATRTLVRESGQVLANDFQRVNKDLVAVQGDLDMQVRTHVEEINQITKEIASLNEKISTIEIQGIPSNDERDRRDVLLKKLNEKIDISWAENETGQLSITAARNAVLVSGFSCQELKAQQSGTGDRVDVYYKSPAGPLTSITETIKGGKLGAIIQTRDQTIEEFKNSVDRLAYTFAGEVNKIHQQGVDLLGRQGQGLFTDLQNIKGAASQINISDVVKKDVNRVVTAMREKGVADNTVANVIASLQDRAILEDGTATMDDFYRSSVGKVGVLTQRAQKESEAQKNILGQLTNLRESISGVSLDEEATKMIEYQKGFDASARLIRTADEMFDTVLSLKRL